MSFPRAKLQRFNDITSEVPSPTKYDPKTGEKVKGGPFFKGEKHSAFSDTASTSTGKSHVQPLFRTPQLPRRHNCLSTDKHSSAAKSITFKQEDQDVYAEELSCLKIECSNKTETIVELEKHIQDLKYQLADYGKMKEDMLKHIQVLEQANSDLDCVRTNSQNYEQQISDLKVRLDVLERELATAVSSKEESDMKNTKLEESNLDYERKIISLEGTVEHLEVEYKNKMATVEELQHEAERLRINHAVSLECLNGKIATLENEMKTMEQNKSKNEETIFGLETQISNLNCIVDTYKGEKVELEARLTELRDVVSKYESNCKLHNDTITGLDMQLEEKTKDLTKALQKCTSLQEQLGQQVETAKQVQLTLDQLKSQSAEEIVKLEDAKRECEEEIKELEEELAEKEELLSETVKNKDTAIEALTLEVQAKADQVCHELKENQKLIKKLKELEDEKCILLSCHAEESLKLQNEYEMKLLTHMQESADKLAALQQQITGKTQALTCLETTLRETETAYQSVMEQLESHYQEKMRIMEETHSKKLEDLESLKASLVERKDKEIKAQEEQYKELVEEMQGLISDIEKKNEQLKHMTAEHEVTKVDLEKAAATNDSLNSRLKVMLEEIKLLNKETEAKCEELKATAHKYHSEAARNEKLSEQLGELDSKLRQMKDDMRRQLLDKDKMAAELKYQLVEKDKVLADMRQQKDALQTRKTDLEVSVVELKDKTDQLTAELVAKKQNFDVELKRVYGNLTEVKRQCRKFEIAMADTRKSLEALGERLIESETEVEKLNHDKEQMREQLAAVEIEKMEVDKSNKALEQSKRDLEESLVQLEEANSALSQQCCEYKAKQTEAEREVEQLRQLQGQLEQDKTEYEASLITLGQLVKQQEAMMDELERNAAAQVQAVSQALIDKLEQFQLFSTEKIAKLSSNLKHLRTEKKQLEERLQTKSEETENLMTDHEILKTTLDITMKESEKNKCDLSQLEKDMLELKEAKTSVETLLLQKTEEYNVLQEISNEKYAEVEKLTEEWRTEKQERVTLEQELSSVRDANARFKETEEELREELSQVERERKEVERELEEVKAKLEETEMNSEWKTKHEQLLEELLEVQERKDYYKTNCQRLEMLAEELCDEKKSLQKDFDELHAMLQGKDGDMEGLKKRIRELESLVGPFRELLEQYESERMFIESDREQLRKQHLEQAAKLGHQNHKQKIQHMVKLKGDLLETRKENEKLALEVKNLKKTVEKLREKTGQHPKRLFVNGQRPSSTPFKGKENSVMSPSSMLTPMAVKQEPMSPSSPLRNRNH